MNHLIKTVLVLLTLATISNATYAQGRYRAAARSKYYSEKWYANDYYYGADGYYARMKEKCRKNNSDRNIDYENDFCYYEKTKDGYWPVFRKAKYAQDRYGRGYLYLPNEKEKK